jgi:hypothetical protein
MTGPTISSVEIDGLFAKLDGLQLTDKERVLLRAILHAAADVGEAAESPEERSFSEEFAASFKQNHAESIVAHFGAQLPDGQVVNLITRSLITRGLITRRTQVSDDK